MESKWGGGDPTCKTPDEEEEIQRRGCNAWIFTKMKEEKKKKMDDKKPFCRIGFDGTRLWKQDLSKEDEERKRKELLLACVVGLRWGLGFGERRFI